MSEQAKPKRFESVPPERIKAVRPFQPRPVVRGEKRWTKKP